MKLNTNIYEGKPPSLEEAPTRYQRIVKDSSSNCFERNNGCNRCIQLMKVILYLELILLIGWIGCVFINNYYWDHGYHSVHEPYDILEKTQDHDGQDSVTNSDPLSAEDIGWSIREDDSKVAIEKDKTHTESMLMIEGKNDLIETEVTTIPSLIETDATDMNESMLLSKWLDSLKRPINNLEERSSKFDSFWHRGMSSVEEENDKLDPSSNEEMTLPEESNTAATTQDYFDIMGRESDELAAKVLDDLLSLPLWQDFIAVPDYVDIITDLDKDSLEDDHHMNMRFDFQFPDLVERHLSRQARTTAGQNESSSSSSSEESNSPVPEEKVSSESSSSEETKNPAPKVKRSAESSSSESDSSDSSSNENEQTQRKAIKGKTSCPKILDDDGSTIDDPKDIVNHIKRNWFNWLLETPVPDCDEPKSVKTVSIDECGKFVITCTADESDERDGKESVKNHRDTRSVEENVVQREMCERLINETRIKIESLRKYFVFGELDDAMAISLRDQIENAFMTLSIQLIVDQLTGVQNRTDQQWHNSLSEIRQKTMESTDAEHRQQLEEHGGFTQEAATKLRNAIESVAKTYGECHDLPMKSEDNGQGFMGMEVLIEREKCSRSLATTRERVDSLAAAIVTGDSSDPTIIGLRQRFVVMIQFLTSRIIVNLGQQHGPDVIHTGPVNVTDAQWSTYMLELKQEIAKVPEDSNIRQRLEASVTPTQEQTNELRAIVEYYIRENAQCSGRRRLGWVRKRRGMVQDANRGRRSADRQRESGYIGASRIYEDLSNK